MKRRWASADETKEDIKPIMFNVTTQETEGYTYTPSNIRVSDNKIFFYGDIDQASILDLNKTLWEMDTKLQHTKISVGEGNLDPVCELHLLTYGGELDAAFSTVDTIRQMKSSVHTYIDGACASAGTFISAVGDKRYMGKHSLYLIHQLRSEFYGKFSEIEDEFYNLEVCMKIMKNFYKEYTKIPMKKLDELLKHDLWLSPEECIAYGMVDEIL